MKHTLEKNCVKMGGVHLMLCVACGLESPRALEQARSTHQRWVGLGVWNKNEAPQMFTDETPTDALCGPPILRAPSTHKKKAQHVVSGRPGLSPAPPRHTQAPHSRAHLRRRPSRPLHTLLPGPPPILPPPYAGLQMQPAKFHPSPIPGVVRFRPSWRLPGLSKEPSKGLGWPVHAGAARFRLTLLLPWSGPRTRTRTSDATRRISSCPLPCRLWRFLARQAGPCAHQSWGPTSSPSFPLGTRPVCTTKPGRKEVTKKGV